MDSKFKGSSVLSPTVITGVAGALIFVSAGLIPVAAGILATTVGIHILQLGRSHPEPKRVPVRVRDRRS